MEELALESNAFFMGIEYLAVFCSGLMGGLCAVRKNYDLFAMLITAWLTALGGGIIRDVMLGSLPPVGISDRGYILVSGKCVYEGAADAMLADDSLTKKYLSLS